MPYKSSNNCAHRLIVQLAAVSLLGLGGCLHLQQELVLAAGNRGGFSLACSLPTAVVEQYLKPVEASVAPAWGRWFDAGQGGAALARVDGLRVTSYRVFVRGERTYLHIAGELSDVRGVLTSGSLGAFELNTEGEQNVLKLNLPPLSKAAAGAWPEVVGDVRMRLRVTAPEEVLGGTADRVEKQTAIWDLALVDESGDLAPPPAIELRYR